MSTIPPLHETSGGSNAGPDRWRVQAILAISLVHGLAAGAAEIKVLSAAGIKTVVDELGPQFDARLGTSS